MLFEPSITALRSLLLIIPTLLTFYVVAASPLKERSLRSGLLASIWIFPFLLSVNLIAVNQNWWVFHAQGGLLLGIPLDVLLCWSWCWGFLYYALSRHVHWGGMILLLILLDLLLMPKLIPLLELGPNWLMGEILAILACLMPAQFLANWFYRDQNLVGRSALYALVYVAYFFVLLPSIAMEYSLASRNVLIESWKGIFFQLMIFPFAMGFMALVHFVKEGHGTPVPWDFPTFLVTSGPYAYMRNPMQTATALAWILLGVLSGDWIFYVGVIVILAFSEGFAHWHEAEELSNRFGQDWQIYRQEVPSWWPRWKPWFGFVAVLGPRLYIAGDCSPCSQLRRWFERRHPRCLEFVEATKYPGPTLTRLTYVSAKGEIYQGLPAFCQALNHLNLGWAMAGWILSLPVLCQFVQILMDAVGAGPRLAASDTHV